MDEAVEGTSAPREIELKLECGGVRGRPMLNDGRPELNDDRLNALVVEKGELSLSHETVAMWFKHLREKESGDMTCLDFSKSTIRDSAKMDILLLTLRKKR